MQAEIEISGRNINNCRYVDGTTPRAEGEPLDESERGKPKSCLKTQHLENEDHGIWSHHLMANRWGNNGNSERFIFWGGGSKSLLMVTADMKLKGTCSLGKKL